MHAPRLGRVTLTANTAVLIGRAARLLGSSRGLQDGAQRPSSVRDACASCRPPHRPASRCRRSAHPLRAPSVLPLQRPTRTFASELLGPEGAALFSWSPTGDLLAAAGFRVCRRRRLTHVAAHPSRCMTQMGPALSCPAEEEGGAFRPQWRGCCQPYSARCALHLHLHGHPSSAFRPTPSTPARADPEFLYDESQETPVLALSWHPWSSHLAILPRGQPFAMVWSTSGELAHMDSGIKASTPACLCFLYPCSKRVSNMLGGE